MLQFSTSETGTLLALKLVKNRQNRIFETSTIKSTSSAGRKTFTRSIWWHSTFWGILVYRCRIYLRPIGYTSFGPFQIYPMIPSQKIYHTKKYILHLYTKWGLTATSKVIISAPKCRRSGETKFDPPLDVPGSELCSARRINVLRSIQKHPSSFPWKWFSLERRKKIKHFTFFSGNYY